MVLQVRGRETDLGDGFRVSRLLPSAACRSVGPFVFLDYFGPTSVGPATNIDVRPHPHIGLATVTYLCEGAMLHRDSLGSVQRIEPGAINWMSAGRGIVHSERRPADLRQSIYRLHGLQLWVALPRDLEESEPSFVHTPSAQLPRLVEQGVDVRVLVGAAFGRKSPVRTASATLLIALELGRGAQLELPHLAPEVAVLPLADDLDVDGERVPRGALAVLEPATGVTLHSDDAGEVVILGGDALDGPRHMWWNFVSSRKERIEQAANDWEQQRMGSIAGEADVIGLPARRPVLSP